MENCVRTTTEVKQANVLTKIVDTKVEHIAALKQRFPTESLKPQISDRSLYEALKAPNAGFIFECKKASPSKGLIRENFDVEAIADVYVKYAAGISVLTDEQFFQGDMDYIPQVRQRVTQPILCKDFFVDRYQVQLAAHQGADAILLMLSVLTDEQYQQLAIEANKFSLDILTEVSNEEELHRAVALNAKIIGINNRNLRDLSTDLATTEHLAPLIPSDTVVISESGIYTHQQVLRLSPLVDGFLVGSSLMAEDDLDLACRTLTFGHNKVCGLTTLENAQHVSEFGAIYGGLIFAEKSPRYISPQQALDIVTAHRASSPALHFVGVFVDESVEKIAAIANELNLYAVQLHGSETQYSIEQLKQQLAKLGCQAQVWKAIAVDVNTSTIDQLSLPDNADRLLYDSKLDTGDTQHFGGTGSRFNWQASLPNKALSMLAGGLNTENAQQASQQGFLGLDLNSGLETQPGQKDPQQIKAAFAAIRQY
ncbi:bifunctional indole-3-glycerol-phosphate synthase TrpC/phosphoribosylanthranilate isomerase TrpF [Shewanella waksmanii]|uniref:bifunctional indole-3-glycerol-phosphate synthase TrpC/phosphoribosylanthranilate isomerase TrpF n=1 Tax=Shewanella waksmanii TaxID=213783 RepID=UPI0037366A76